MAKELFYLVAVQCNSTVVPHGGTPREARGCCPRAPCPRRTHGVGAGGCGASAPRRDSSRPSTCGGERREEGEREGGRGEEGAGGEKRKGRGRGGKGKKGKREGGREECSKQSGEGAGSTGYPRGTPARGRHSSGPSASLARRASLVLALHLTCLHSFTVSLTSSLPPSSLTHFTRSPSLPGPLPRPASPPA